VQAAGASLETKATTEAPGWLRGPAFDLVFLLGSVVLALAAAHTAGLAVDAYAWVFFLDMWLLGFHHVFSTYTRLVFDRESFVEHRFLVLGLPPIVFAAMVTAYATCGPWLIITAYLYVQAFHYTRQSFGLERIYGAKGPARSSRDASITRWALYLVPLAGIIHRTAPSPTLFLDMEIRCIPVPPGVEVAAEALAAIALAAWAVRRAQDAWHGRLAVPATIYFLTHVLIMVDGYFLIDDIDRGWLLVNVWHNFQYILFTWVYNKNRFKQGIVPQKRFLSTISQSVVLYWIGCLALSSAFYFLLGKGVLLTGALAGPLIVVAHQTLNFHHYLSDAVLWKVRRPALRRTLGIG
jgi:hypothetical protein